MAITVQNLYLTRRLFVCVLSSSRKRKLSGAEEEGAPAKRERAEGDADVADSTGAAAANGTAADGAADAAAASDADHTTSSDAAAAAVAPDAFVIRLRGLPFGATQVRSLMPHDCSLRISNKGR
jgi:hypothetical protein